MCKRETLVLAMVVAAAALTVVFFFPSSVHAASVYPLQGKVINDNLPEIKWEDGEPGMDPSGKVNFLGSSMDNLTRSDQDSTRRIDHKKYSLTTYISRNLLLRLIISRIFLNY